MGWASAVKGLGLPPNKERSNPTKETQKNTEKFFVLTHIEETTGTNIASSNDDNNI
jgi:hypothetical protein